MSLRFLGQFLISESLQGDDDGGHDRECFSRYRRVIFLLSQGQPFIASRVLRSVADCSHSRSFDQRRRPRLDPRSSMIAGALGPVDGTFLSRANCMAAERRGGESHGFWERRVTLAYRGSASDHSSARAVHAPLTAHPQLLDDSPIRDIPQMPRCRATGKSS
jgi:hypothetical protein